MTTQTAQKPAEETTARSTMPSIDAQRRAADRRFTRPLTLRDLHTIALALGASVAHLHDTMWSTSGSYYDGELWTQLRAASEALGVLTDHICNDSRWDDDDEEPASAAPTAEKAQPASAAPTHAPAPAAGTPRPEPRVHRTTIDRLQALRSEFIEHPDDIDLLLDLARTGVAVRTAQEATPS